MKQLIISIFYLFVLLSTAVAGETLLLGNKTQGGLIFGITDPENKVELNGKKIRLSDEGHFLIGFGRDAPKKAFLKIITHNGKIERRVLKVKAQTYIIQKISGLPTRKVTPKLEDLARIKADNKNIAKVRALNTNKTYFSSGFVWPVNGPISGFFGSQRILNGKPKNTHKGVDIAAPEGTPILASADGIVVLVDLNMFYTGKTVMLDHGFGLTSVYAHMSAASVEEGEFVKKGDVIGKVGKTGRATGPHLHWGVTLHYTHLDPLLLVGKSN